MKFRLRRVGVMKAAIVGGIGYAIMSLVFVPFLLFISFVAPMADAPMGPGEWMFGPVFALLMPLIYGVMGFIFTGIGAAIYNLIAMMVGGLEIELEGEGGSAVPVAPPAAY